MTVYILDVSVTADDAALDAGQHTLEASFGAASPEAVRYRSSGREGRTAMLRKSYNELLTKAQDALQHPDAEHAKAYLDLFHLDFKTGDTWSTSYGGGKPNWDREVVLQVFGRATRDGFLKQPAGQPKTKYGSPRFCFGPTVEVSGWLAVELRMPCGRSLLGTDCKRCKSAYGQGVA